MALNKILSIVMQRESSSLPQQMTDTDQRLLVIHLRNPL